MWAEFDQVGVLYKTNTHYSFGLHSISTLKQEVLTLHGVVTSSVVRICETKKGLLKT